MAPEVAAEDVTLPTKERFSAASHVSSNRKAPPKRDRQGELTMVRSLVLAWPALNGDISLCESPEVYR